MAFDSVQEWHIKYGAAYKKLALAYDYLKTCKKVAFDDVEGRSLVERQREEARVERQQRQREKNLNKVLTEISEMDVEIQSCLTQLDNCLQLLLPSPDNFDIAGVYHTPSKSPDDMAHRDTGAETDDAERPATGVDKNASDLMKEEADVEKHITGVDNDDTDAKKHITGVDNDDINVEKHGAGEEQEHVSDSGFVRQHGLGSLNYNIQVCISDIQLTETEDNVDLLDTLQDTMRLVTSKFLPLTRHWMQAMTKCGGSHDQISRVLQMKQNLEHVTHKVAQLKIQRRSDYVTRGSSKQEEDDDSEDDDFEDVPQKEGYEATVPDHIKEQPQSSGRRPWTGGGGEEWVLSQLCGEEGDPTTGQISHPSSNLSAMEQGTKPQAEGATNRPYTSSSGACQKKMAKCGVKNVPVVPYGTDLLDWGEDFEVPIIARFDMGHRFWAPPREEIVDKNALESKRTRLINFTGTFEPVKWTCRASMGNGQLCPRMDRFKCPFHGKIIARDDKGKPRDKEDVKREKEKAEEKKQESAPEWEDPELQREIQVATGVDLRRKTKGKGHGKQSSLTDLKESGTSSRKRLEAKIFKRTAMKKVAEAMNAIDAKRFKDKFGNNFNYTHSHT